MRILIFTALLSALIAAANGQNGGPVQAKRIPADKIQAPARSNNILDRYDFGAQIDALQDTARLSSDSPPVRPVVAAGATEGQPSLVPDGYRPKTDVQLTPTAREAVQMSAKWMGERNQPAAGRDGRVLYAFGAGLPTVVCAPLRVCMIELQSGEKLVGEPQIGDSIRWLISPAMYGSGESATSLVVLKPQSPGLDTNLLITTDRRAYYLRLLSKPDDYVARVAFAYPDDEENQRQWREHMAQQKERERKQSHIAELPTTGADSLCFSYQVKGGDSTMRPLRVFDDGKQTYIQMSPKAKNREAPVLVVLGADRKQEMVNYRVREDMYIVDRLFDHAQLVLGSGKKARKVEISRDRKS